MTDLPPTTGAATAALLDQARAEAARLGHDFLGSEHLLLALLASDREEVGRVLDQSGVERGALRERMQALAPAGEASTPPDQLTVRGGARRILDQASAEARKVNSPSTEPEHVYLALLRDRRGPVAQVLGGTQANLDKARRILAGPPEAAPSPAPREPAPPPAPRARDLAAPTTKKDRGRPREPRAEAPAPPQRTRPPREAQPEPEPEEPPRSPPRTAILAHRDPILTWRNLMLLAVPASIGLNLVHASPVLIFVTACAGVIPLAGYMGDATEHLTQRTNPTIGGFLNATFGNAAELIIALMALRAGLVDLVKASITGSILGNLLLIMGLALIAGSSGKLTVRFNRTAAGMSTAMLALAVAGLVFPAIFHHLHPNAQTQELYLSEGVAVVLGITYVLSLIFSLRTHRDLFRGEPHGTGGTPWSVTRSLVVLAVATAGVAVESEILVHSVEAVTATLGLSEIFLGLIIIPIIGNAAEHATAVIAAKKGQIDLGLNIALGSSTQVALLVAPILVGAGVLFGQDMDLVFSTFEVAGVGIATIVTAIIALDGETHWFEGAQLLALYALVGLAAFFL